ncbi:MAG: DUF4954 family protein [Treponema sp.]|nr:DUF4954 family protein [Treponema sp.]
MVTVSLTPNLAQSLKPPAELLDKKRHLTAEEIAVLVKNRNISSDPDWNNVYVSEGEGQFDPECIVQSEFDGWVVLGTVRHASLRYHDLELNTGVYRSMLSRVCLGDDCVVNNVSYLVNYRIGNRVMLFNIQEMSCTTHSKFGNGVLKQGEEEDVRIWIGVGNENGNRSVLPFESMIPADAFLWSRYRENKALMSRFVELTENGNDKTTPTYGIVSDDAVIKNCTLIKDAKIGNDAYIKGAFKLKNITVLSSPEEPSQIGEGVELVNGIMGFGSRVFYQAVAVRFVIGRNCQLKYGARLLNSVLGDNSTVSCCELLNNLIFPFHEQHHNSSFLIAATLQGQSNIASAATIGSNHNSRSPDGEMIAGRGFWPGLCCDFKYDSRFASFVLVAKGSYKNELNITYPFSLVAASPEDGSVHIIPAYWFLYNMFAIERNRFKFAARDKRVVKVQHIETDPLAPDTMQEVVLSLDRIIQLTYRWLLLDNDTMQKMTVRNAEPEVVQSFRQKAFAASSEQEGLRIAKDFLHHAQYTQFLLSDDRCQKKSGALIYKPLQGYRAYRRILKYFAADCLITWCSFNGKESLENEDLERIETIPLFTEWVNAGGQIIPEQKVQELFGLIVEKSINTWKEVHTFYDDCQKNYIDYKARYALYVFETLYERPLRDFTTEIFADITSDVAYVSMEMLESSIASRSKDYTDFFRSITFRNKDEVEAVLGTMGDNSFLRELREATDDFNTNLERLFKKLRF